jgi:hypothetical protein
MHVITPAGLSAGTTAQLPTGGLVDVANWCGADAATTISAASAVAPRLVVSGRLSSGKDTVAAAVMATLGHTDSVQVSFATALRDEMAILLDAVRSCNDVEDAVTAVATVGSVTTDTARNTATLLWQAVRQDPAITPWTRTREMRLALQDWGTDVRRAADPHHWVKLGARRVIEAIATGRSVHITDARFANEVQIARALGFHAVRLEVDLDIRAQRLWDRDGLVIDPASENHPSEAELETYQGFDQWVSNNGPLAETVDLIIGAFR